MHGCMDACADVHVYASLCLSAYSVGVSINSRLLAILSRVLLFCSSARLLSVFYSPIPILEGSLQNQYVATTHCHMCVYIFPSTHNHFGCSLIFTDTPIKFGNERPHLWWCEFGRESVGIQFAKHYGRIFGCARVKQKLKQEEMEGKIGSI